MSVSIKPGAWRLGNFCFQIAAGASLAYDNEVDFIEPDFGYNQYFRREYKSFNSKKPFIFRWKEPLNFKYQEIDYVGPTELEGYFQSYKYFAHNDTYIRQIFERRGVIPDKKIVTAMFNEETTVAIHVRRGDYAKYPDHHPMLDMHYYNTAMEEIKRSCNPSFFVFSDDIQWCKENFTDVTFIENNTDIVDFHSMTLCDHHIIANSSFSWWTAWLSDSPNKIVIAPHPENKWFGKALRYYDMSDLIPNTWNTI